MPEPTAEPSLGIQLRMDYFNCGQGILGNFPWHDHIEKYPLIDRIRKEISHHINFSNYRVYSASTVSGQETVEEVLKELGFKEVGRSLDMHAIGDRICHYWILIRYPIEEKTNGKSK